MNLMQFVISNNEFTSKSKKLDAKVNKLKETFKKSKIKVGDKNVKIGNTFYYDNILPNISINRDVLKKSNEICNIRVNWKKKDLTVQEAIETLKEQWGWNITIVDAEHTRNKFKNKSDLWVIFDTEEKAKKALNLFNSMFITAIELDCIEEYKKFKQNPDKRPLTFDKLVPNYQELYEAVDNHEI